MPLNEADTCRTYVLPKLYSADWDDTQIGEQKSFTDGRIVLVGNRAIRRPQKRADYLLRYRRDFPISWCVRCFKHSPSRSEKCGEDSHFP